MKDGKARRLTNTHRVGRLDRLVIKSLLYSGCPLGIIHRTHKSSNFVFILTISSKPFLQTFLVLLIIDHLAKLLDYIYKSIEVHIFAMPSSEKANSHKIFCSFSKFPFLVCGRDTSEGVRILRMNTNDSHSLSVLSLLFIGMTYDNDETVPL